MTEELTHIVLFKGKEVRRTIHNDEWWFSVSDVVELLTDSKDIRQYIKRMRSRDAVLNANWGTICTPLEMIARDGRKREVTCANTEGLFRIIQSIPSPKAESPQSAGISKLAGRLNSLHVLIRS
jgi:DNA-damage-inducible protein D